MSSYSFDKKDCLNRAEILLEKGDIASLRYACLELRQCIEAIAYKKASTYRKFVPENNLNTWQPKQVFDFLEQIAPLSTADYTFKIYKQEPDGRLGDIVTDIGHKTLKKNYFNKYYNKLGSYLHTPTLAQQVGYSENINKLQKFIMKVIEDLRPLVECRFDSNFGIVFRVECCSCKEIIYLRRQSLNVDSVFSCLRSECQTQHQVLELGDDNTLNFIPRHFTLTCSCGKSNSINIRNHKESYSLICDCGKSHFLQKAWHHKESL